MEYHGTLWWYMYILCCTAISRYLLDPISVAGVAADVLEGRHVQARSALAQTASGPYEEAPLRPHRVDHGGACVARLR